jgi:hypothetical protein
MRPTGVAYSGIFGKPYDDLDPARFVVAVRVAGYFHARDMDSELEDAWRVSSSQSRGGVRSSVSGENEGSRREFLFLPSRKMRFRWAFTFPFSTSGPVVEPGADVGVLRPR